MLKRLTSSPAAFGLVALILITAVRAPAFYAASNLRDLALNIAPTLVAAIGMTLVILLGEIDISIGAQYAICAILAGMTAKAGMPVIVVALAAMAAGSLLGAINGVLVAQFRIPSIVVTLAAMMALRDLLRWTTQGAWIQNLPASFQWAGLGQTAGSILIAILAVAVFAAFLWALQNLRAGRAVYAVGCSPESARMAGLDPKPITIAVFAISGMLAGLSAVLGSLRFTDIQSGAGVGLEMKVIAAVVVGGIQAASPFVDAWRETCNYLGMNYCGLLHANCRDGYVRALYEDDVKAFVHRLRIGVREPAAGRNA